MLWLTPLALPHAGQSQITVPEAQSAEQGSAGQSLTVLKITTREVVVDLVAADRHDQSVADLQASDLSVFETGSGRQRTEQRITSVRYVAPLSGGTKEVAPGGLHVRLGSGCAEKTTGHYEITFHVSSGEIREGEHTLQVTTLRPGIKLNYGSHYYVAGVRRLEPAPKSDDREAEAHLLQAACFHSDRPLSLPLLVHAVTTSKPGELRFQLTIPPPALPLASMAVDSRDVVLEYAACSFDQNGRPLHFMHTSENRALRSSEYVQATLRGFPSFIDLPGTEQPAAIRFVVKDPRTGNLGAVLVETPRALKAGELTPDEIKAAELWKQHQSTLTLDNVPPMGPIGSFGSVEPRAGAMCGDVYELAAGTSKLPNFWSLDSVGSIYAYVLDVPHQQFWGTGGIPGISRATEWFGIDYHAAFQVEVPGQYEFSVLADDGAKVYVDDHLVLDADHIHDAEAVSGKITLQAGWHTLHVPYFQGPPTSVALQLFVKKPGGTRQLFDIREFGAASSADARMDLKTR